MSLTKSNKVPTVDSHRNMTVGDSVGNKDDCQHGNSAHAKLFALAAHVQSCPKCWPANDAPIPVEASATPWELGAIKELIPENGVVQDFDIVAMSLTVTDPGFYQIQLYANGVPVTGMPVSVHTVFPAAPPGLITAGNQLLSDCPVIEGKQAITARVSSDVPSAIVHVTLVYFTYQPEA